MAELTAWMVHAGILPRKAVALNPLGKLAELRMVCLDAHGIGVISTVAPSSPLPQGMTVNFISEIIFQLSSCGNDAILDCRKSRIEVAEPPVGHSGK